MRFNVTLIDPPAYRYGHFLFDIVRALQGGLEDLGHRCTIRRNDVETGAINVLVGVHVLEDRGYVDQILDSGVKYVVIQSEIVVGRSLNHQTQHFTNIVLPLISNSLGVWDGLESNVAALRQIGIDAKLLRMGFTPRLIDFAPRQDRDVDFCFVGTITENRRRVLDALQKLGYRLEILFDDGAPFRNDLFSRTEVILTLRQSDVQAHLPSARIVYMAHNRCLVAGDGGREQEPFEDLFLWDREGDVVEFLRQTRARRDRRELADRFHENLRKRPMSAALDPLLAALKV